MPTYLTETLYRFCTRENGYSRWQQNKSAYQWILTHWMEFQDTGELISKSTFRAGLLFMEKVKKAPASVQALAQWVIHNPSQDSRFQKSDKVELELADLADYEPMELDDDVLFDALVAKAREEWASVILKSAAGIAKGSKPPGVKGDETGVSVAFQWVRGEMAKDFAPEAAVLDGVLSDNIPAILQGIESRLTTNINGRFKLGLPHIDRNVTVGRQNLRFIGVAGMSGDGKTTLTNFITYNWLLQGAHVLYVSTEHSPEEIWNFMAWLHQSHADYGFVLPPMHDWEGGRETGKVKPQDENNLIRILDDIQRRKNLPGFLECKQFRDWDAIRDYVIANHSRNKYDAVVIDYISRLNVPGDQKFRDKALGAVVHDIQNFTRVFDENRGLIVLTPLQVNREGNKRANATPDMATSRYDLNCISTISEFQHDLDLVLTVWSDADMKMTDEIEIEQIKQRSGRASIRMRMRLNRNSGAFTYAEPTPAQVSHWHKTVDDVMAETVTINTENWSL